MSIKLDSLLKRIEKLHPKVQIYLEDPNKVPGGANRKFEVIKNNK